MSQPIVNLGKPKVAIVDDNDDYRTLLQIALNKDFETASYGSGLEALKGLSRLKPDLILLDISLPDIDGTEVLKRLRSQEEFERVPIICVTAHAMAGDRRKYLQAGFDEYFSKPINSQELISTIRKWL